MEHQYNLAKWLSGEMDEKELISFQNSPDYPIYERIAKYSSQLEAPKLDIDEFYNKVTSHRQRKSKVIFFSKRNFLKIAAIFLMILGISFIYNSTKSNIEIAEIGKRTSFSLPDNSNVVLNSDSKIEYVKWNWNNNRTLNLNGEAYFKVAKGKKFEVSTSLGKVAVLGTQFNVKSRKNKFEVTCYEGKVRVLFKNKKIIIKKGTSVCFSDTFFEEKNTIATKPEWTENQLVFRHETFQNIIEELQRTYNINIELKCSPNNQLFTGILPANDSKIAFEIITTTYHLKLSKFENGKIILFDN